VLAHLLLLLYEPRQEPCIGWSLLQGLKAAYQVAVAFKRFSILESSSNLRLLQIEILTWKILARNVNSGKQLDAILKSSTDPLE
jgi:hypothetical protein